MMKRVLILLFLVLPANAALTDNLQLYVPFDGNADDISGNGNNGIVYGATLTTDRNANPNSAYQFNGVDSYIDFGTSDLGLTGSSEITFCAWIKPDQPTTYHSQVLSSEQFYRPYMIRTRGLGSAVTAQCGVRTVNGGDYIDADINGIIVGSWYHIACTYDGINASIYVNGVLQNSVSMSGSLIASSQHILVGANPTSPPKNFFHGAIDDIRIWNRALNEDEIIEVYSGEPAPCVDADGDGWYSTAVCNDGIHYDCLDDPVADPYAPFVNPGVIESSDLCSNGYDDDCVGGDLICNNCPLDDDDPVPQRCLCENMAVETGYCCSDGTYSLIPCNQAPIAVDNDGDGWYSDGQYNLNGLPDCDDNNPFVFPLNTNNYCDCDGSDGFGQGTVEVCGNGIDEDCDGFDLPCTGGIYVGGYEVNHDFDGITDECLDLIRTKTILFGGRSISGNTIYGLYFLGDKNPRYKLDIVSYNLSIGETIPDDIFDTPKFVHYSYVISPVEGRWTTFDSYSRTYHDKIDAAFQFLHSSYAGCPQALFDDYTPVFDALLVDVPDIQFAIATHTLDTRTNDDARFNFEGKWYSDKIKETYTGVVPIFDLEDIESTRADDSICEFNYGGTIYRRMCPEYNTNGDYIHPNSEEARERLGKGILVLLSKMFCEQQPQPVECTVDSECDDHLACNGLEACVNNKCVPGTPIDCSAYDIAPVGTCNNNPDNNPFTWDYGEAFISQCIEPGICTTTAEQEITSICSVLQCGAQCDADNPCPSTDCDGFDGCVGNDYYDYHDVGNNCLNDCSCETNPCNSLTIYPNDMRCTGYQVDESLKLYTPFDGNADDISGNGNNGIVYGATLTTDRNGNPNSAYQFNGVDSYIDFGTSDLGLTGSSEMTFCAWIKPDQPTTYHSQVLSSEQFYRPYMIRTRGLGSAVTAQCGVRTVNGGDYIDADINGIIVGSWYHIACTYDGINASIYVNGVLQNSVSMSGSLMVSSQHILVGANSTSPPSGFFHGAIDDIRIWNRALSTSEIQNLQYE